MANCYASLTRIKSMLGITDTTHDADLLVMLNAASRQIDNYCGRHFYVKTEAKYFDGATKLRLDDLLSLTELKTDEDSDLDYDNTLDTGDYLLYPYNGYPKTELVLHPSGDYSSFGVGAMSVKVTGSWGYAESASPYSASGATVNTGNITDSATTHALATGKGACFSAGQTILIGSEQLYITSISADTLAFTRAANGTTAAAHTSGDAIYIYEYPEPIVQAALIQAMRWYKRKDSAFADSMGNPETGMVVVAKGIDPDVRIILNEYRKWEYT